MAIIIAYDGMKNTKKALEYAIEHSKVYKEKLYIFSVITSKDMLDKEKELLHVKEYLEDAEKIAISKGADAEILLESSTPAKGILEAAERFGVKTIVVGRSDKTAFDRAVLGSVSEYVVRNAKCTVIVVQ
ncbi:MAG: universal stress protein [Candidatus Methanomethylophilaceae archaeon]|jgi:nucleotide-binding universal stress UspA family protein